jgi:hypothetical protein
LGNDFHNSPTYNTMDSASASAESLRQQIVASENELKRLKEQLASVEAENARENGERLSDDAETGSPVTSGKWPLSSEEYKRYGRQMIVPNIGIQGSISSSEFVGNIFAYYFCRSTPSQSRFGTHRGSWWSGMSSSSLHSRRRRGSYWNHRRR